LLFISEDTVAVPGDRSSAYYGVFLEVNGAVVFSSGATLSSNTTGHDFVLSGTELGGVGTQDGQRFRFDFAPFTGVVNLGDFAPAQTLSVVYRLEAGIDIPGFEVSAAASIGDPLSLAGSGLAVTASPVSLPGTFGLMLAALGGLGRCGGWPRARRAIMLSLGRGQRHGP